MAQRMKEPSITDPSLLLDQFVMHDGDVSCGAAEADPSQLEPELQRFPEGGSLHCIESFILRDVWSEGRPVTST
jgi:hypothetical protein